METQTRPSNIIDVLRLIAALAIVWHHSNYLAIQQVESKLAITIGLLIQWALPFFYITSAYFSISPLKHKTHIKTFNKVISLALLLLFYSFFTLIFRHFVYGKELIIINMVEFIKTGNATPAYYLFDLIIITIIGHIIHFFSRDKVEGIIIVSILLLLTSTLSTTILINQPQFIPLILWGYLLAFIKHDNIKYYLPSYSGIIILLLIPFVSVLFDYNSWFRLFLFILFFWFTTLSQVPDIKLITQISEWGAYYSFGIFVTHVYFVQIYDLLLPITLGNITNNHHVLYVLIIILGTLSSIVCTKIFGQTIPFLIYQKSNSKTITQR